MRTGSCRCGNIKYEVNDDSTNGVICYCVSCQKLHSSHSLNIQSEVSKVKVTQGTPKVFNDTKTDSGKAIARSFCPDCGSHLWSDPESSPGTRFLKVGAFDNPKDVKLVAEIYVEDALDHQVIPKERCGQKHFEGMLAKEV